MRRSFLQPLTPRRAGWIAFAAGLSLPFAFEPFGLWPLAFLGPVVLLWLWRTATPGRAAWFGMLFGFGHFVIGGSWVFVAMNVYGKMDLVSSLLVTFLFVAYLGSYTALTGWLQATLAPKNETLRLLVVTPAVWVLTEWLRGAWLSGFTWLQLGYSQIDTPLSGYAPWFGSYFVTWAVVAVSALLAFLAGDPRPRAPRVALTLAALWAGGWAAGLPRWTEPAGPALRVALVQGNIPIEQKWLAQNRYLIADYYARTTFALDSVDLVLWPESAIPAYRDELETDFFEPLARTARERNLNIILGSVEREGSPDDRVLYNSAIGLGDGGGVYRKQHLVPLGEFMPFGFITHWIFRTLDIPMSDFSSGPPNQPPIELSGQKIGASICYEAAFGEEIIQTLPEATLLANLSEDAWFGASLGPHQHLQMARMRSKETERTLLRATNTGISAIIEPDGRIQAQTRQFNVEVLRGTAEPRRGATPYVRWGNGPVLIFALCAVVIGRLVRGRRPARR